MLNSTVLVWSCASLQIIAACTTGYWQDQDGCQYFVVGRARLVASQRQDPETVCRTTYLWACDLQRSKTGARPISGGCWVWVMSRCCLALRYHGKHASGLTLDLGFRIPIFKLRCTCFGANPKGPRTQIIGF